MREKRLQMPVDLIDLATRKGGTWKRWEVFSWLCWEQGQSDLLPEGLPSPHSLPEGLLSPHCLERGREEL